MSWIVVWNSSIRGSQNQDYSSSLILQQDDGPKILPVTAMVDLLLSLEILILYFSFLALSGASASLTMCLVLSLAVLTEILILFHFLVIFCRCQVSLLP